MLNFICVLLVVFDLSSASQPPQDKEDSFDLSGIFEVLRIMTANAPPFAKEFVGNAEKVFNDPDPGNVDKNFKDMFESLDSGARSWHEQHNQGASAPEPYQPISNLFDNMRSQLEHERTLHNRTSEDSLNSENVDELLERATPQSQVKPEPLDADQKVEGSSAGSEPNFVFECD